MLEAAVRAEPVRRTSLRVADHTSGQVLGVTVDATLWDVARLLAAHRISCAVVYEDQRPVGILSERDLVRVIANDPHGWAQRAASAVMTQPLHVTAPDASVVEASRQLARLHIRRLPVVDPDGRLAGIVTQTDLLRASHRRLEEYAADLERLVRERTTELRESELRRNDLVDLTVHDIKNWLNAVDASLEIVAEDPQEASPLLPIIRHTTSRIAGLVAILLDVNRLESGYLPLQFRDMPWVELCDPILAEVEAMARAKSLTLHRDGETHAIIRCDPGLIERVLLNLLDNAISAAPPGSTVDIHAGERAHDGAFVVTVGNRGAVIPRELLPALFRKYRQERRGAPGRESPLKRFGGWGLGLTFCQLVLRQHGGTIRAISPYVDGEGAAFEFALPPDPEREALRLRARAASGSR